VHLFYDSNAVGVLNDFLFLLQYLDQWDGNVAGFDNTGLHTLAYLSPFTTR
jgi:hypothetical protein